MYGSKLLDRLIVMGLPHLGALMNGGLVTAKVVALAAAQNALLHALTGGPPTGSGPMCHSAHAPRSARAPMPPCPHAPTQAWP